MTEFGRRALEAGGHLLRSDGTADCAECEMPLFPHSIEGRSVLLECANRHRATAPVPADDLTRRAAESWIARRGAQLHAQHERWGTDDDVEEAHDR